MGLPPLRLPQDRSSTWERPSFLLEAGGVVDLQAPLAVVGVVVADLGVPSAAANLAATEKDLPPWAF